ncbi:MAG: hypothetical protein DI617_06795, partial [Streptococcus pyogenes]
VTFHYKSYGTFCLHEKRPIISRVDLPTTEIIEPKFLSSIFFSLLVLSYDCFNVVGCVSCFTWWALVWPKIEAETPSVCNCLGLVVLILLAFFCHAITEW